MGELCYHVLMINRIIDIQNYLSVNKVLVIYGPRQVGKTTLVKQYLESYLGKYKFYTGDDLAFVEDISKCSLGFFQKMFSDLDLLVIDEAQKIPEIGRALKIIVDNLKGISVIVTGSSSFDLINKMGESLTGRKIVRVLYPISFQELVNDYGVYDTNIQKEDFLRFGMYPDVVTSKSYLQKQQVISEISNSYLLKDILSFDLVRDSKKIRDLLKLLAFQIGQLVSMNELAKNLDIDKKTVARYLDLLEKSFVIFSLSGFSRNLRKEINKMQKYYFYDLGVRNALISNFNELSLRNDVGALWENFMMIERMKQNSYSNFNPNFYFWRTYDGSEIDLVEEYGGKLFGYEFKFKKDKVKKPLDFLKNYTNSSFEVVTNNNYIKFITKNNVKE